MTYPEHISPFFRAAAGDRGALPERPLSQEDTQPMELDEPIERPLSDEWPEEPTEAGLRMARVPAHQFERTGGYNAIVEYAREHGLVRR